METKDRIFKAAAKIFAQKGFDNASVDEIVLEAKTAKGTFYYHFKSKKELLFALIDQGIDDIFLLIQDGTKNLQNASEKMEKIIEIELDYLVEYRDICRVIFAELWRIESYWKRSVDKIHGKYTKIISQIIKEGIKQKEFKQNIDPKITTTVFFSFVFATGLRWIIFSPKTPKTKIIATVSTIFLDGLKIK